MCDTCALAGLPRVLKRSLLGTNSWAQAKHISWKPPPTPKMMPLAIIWLMLWPVAPTNAPTAAAPAPKRRNHLRPAISERRPPMVTMTAAPKFQLYMLSQYCDISTHHRAELGDANSRYSNPWVSRVRSEVGVDIGQDCCRHDEGEEVAFVHEDQGLHKSCIVRDTS